MKDVVIIAGCVLALAVVWPSATGAAATVLNLQLATRSALVGFLGGLAFSLLVAYAWIYNRLVEADRRKAHDKVDSEHDKRRM